MRRRCAFIKKGVELDRREQRDLVTKMMMMTIKIECIAEDTLNPCCSCVARCWGVQKNAHWHFAKLVTAPASESTSCVTPVKLWY